MITNSNETINDQTSSVQHTKILKTITDQTLSVQHTQLLKIIISITINELVMKTTTHQTSSMQHTITEEHDAIVTEYSSLTKAGN